MTFEQFLTNKIFPVFMYMINWCGQMLNVLMSNYIFKIIIYMSIIFIILSVLKSIYYMIIDKTNSQQKDKGD